MMRKEERERDGATNDTWQGNICKREKEEKRKGRRPTLNLGSSGNIGRVVDTSSLCLDYKRQEKTRKMEDKKKGMSQQVHGVSRRKTLCKNNEDEIELEITHSLLSSGGCRRRRCLPLAVSGPVRKRASADGHGAVGLNLLAVGHLLE